MPDSGEDDGRTLKALRDRIDDIDAQMHGLLMERGTVIEALIRIKGTSRAGAAFRPMREADMMRRLVARHHGALPLATAEHIWREIITTFTRLQAPFDVAIDVSVEPERMRDLARFIFGYSVSLAALDGPEAVIARVAAKGDLGVVARKARGPWWRALARAGAPRIMALVPFMQTEDAPADLPAFVISPPLTDDTAADLTALAVTIEGAWRHADDVEVLATAAANGMTEVLIATPAGTPVADRLRKAGTQVKGLTPVGGFARGIAIGGASNTLYRAAEPAGARV